MQELIEWLDFYENEPIRPIILKAQIKSLLEKEKEQIINAYIDGFPDNWESDKRIRCAKEYYNQESIDAGTLLSDLLTKELEELGDEDLEPREEDSTILRLKEWDDPNTISFRWKSNDEVILKISKEGFYYRGELVEDIHNVYERFNEWLTKIE